MPLVLAGFALTAFAVSWILTAVVVRLGHRLHTFDSAGVEGQVKAETRRIPNTGGLAIAIAILATLFSAVLAIWFGISDRLGSDQLPNLATGVAENARTLWVFMIGLAAMHALGLIDDRKPLPWLPKLGIMLLVPALVVWLTDSRVLTLTDAHVGGSWLSIGITTLWFAVVMNAMNFLDNMDGLAAGLASIIAASLLAIASLNGQWFIAAGSATLLGAALGFLPHNFPKARIFMGDGGSLTLGYMIAFLTVRLTYIPSDAQHTHWHLLLVPAVLLAVPLYDFASVVLIRLAQGRSPFVGDLQHFSHRMDRRGLGNTGAVLAIWALTAITGLGAVVMARTEPWQGAIIAAQTLIVLGLLAFLERGIPERRP